MKTLKKPLSLLMALFMCLGMFAGTGVTAFAAGETMTTYMVDIPRANDPNKAGWGHPALNFLGGWSTSAGTHFSVHTQDAYNGRAIYCIEPGIGVHSGDQYTGRGEDFWDNYPSSLNPTIPPNTIKEYIGRIMTYGWQGNASTSWMSSNPDHANQMAGYIATQLLVWETIVGERDSQFNHVDANAQGKNNVTEYISAEHPLRSQIFSQYSAIESAVKRHTMLPSFFSSTADAGAYELKWDGEKYSATLTDTNGVLGDYTFSSSTAGLNFSVDGSQLTITSSQALKGSVTVKAEKISAQRSGVVVWTDGVTGGGTQDFATYGTTVSDQMVGYLNLEVKTGNMKLIKTSEDGKVEGISFTITGEGYNATKTTNAAGEIDITDLNPGVYTVTEQSIDKYEPQATQRVTIVSGQTATVTFNKAAERNIPLPDRLADCLREAKKKSTSEYVIANRDGEPLSYTQFKRLWQYIVTRTAKPRVYYRYENGKRVKHTVNPVLGEKAAHNGKVIYSLDFDVTPHQLRHTYITNLIHSSVDPKTVQYLAGHESSKITMDIYAKVKYNKPDELAGVLTDAFAQWDEAEYGTAQ